MRTWLSWVVALATGACGDNIHPPGEELSPAASLTIVAHQDDDLLFVQPDLYEAVLRGDGVTNVYVTAGNARDDLDKSEQRSAGLLAAYGAIAGSDAWSCGWILIVGHEVEHCRLATAKLSLVFLGYPDGRREGTAPDSLLSLWEGRVSSVHTVSRRTTTYDQAGLIATLSEIIGQTAPATLRTLEIAATHGRDHSDHMLVGALALLATAQSSVEPEILSFRGYNVASEPANVNPALYEQTVHALGYYEACADACAPCGDTCPADRIDMPHLTWLARRYAVGMRRVADGKLRLGDACVTTSEPGTGAALGDCATAPSWRLDAHGTLSSSTGLCLRALFTGEIIAGTCGDAGAAGRFFLDDEGHLWTGLVPPPAPDMAYAHLDCVITAGGRLRAALCGAGNAPAWELTRTMTATPRDAAMITRTGRAVRMAKLRGQMAMVCAVEDAERGLVCAPGTPGGGLLPAVRIDSPAAPLAVEPESLALGDVDGDGATDACGRDASGIVCATAAAGYQAMPWSHALAAVGPATATDRSLAITPGGKICGLGAAGVVCVSKDETAITDVHSTWPDRRAALWIADLDGDRAADWCAATPDGPACSLAAHRGLSTTGVSWGYALNGTVEGSASDAVPDTATAVFTDVDGDGRADLCTARAGAISCARSQGRGFGPRTPIARLPAGMVPTAVWAEPPRRDRPPRLCAANPTTISCTN